MGVVSILVMWPDQLVSFMYIYHKESSYEILVHLA